MRIFYIAEITGKVGVWAVKKNIAEIKRRYQPDFIIANAGMATGAGGLGKQHAGYLRKMGIDCITGGDCIFQKKDLVENLPQMPFVLRPCNLPEHSLGAGYRYFTARNGGKLAVVSILGRVGRHRLLADNPFTLMQALLPKIERETPFIVADFSSTATAEKQTMAFFLAGRISALVGSGSGAATADAAVVLGAAAWNKQPSPVFLERINHAIALYQSHRVGKIVFTGGTPKKGYMTEAEVGRRYALKQGIPAKNILFENTSRNTYENLRNIKPILRANSVDSIIIVSDPYHLARAQAIARDLDLNAEVSATPTTRFDAREKKGRFLFQESYLLFLYQFESWGDRIWNWITRNG